jgi:hypothetical protein
LIATLGNTAAALAAKAATSTIPIVFRIAADPSNHDSVCLRLSATGSGQAPFGLQIPVATFWQQACGGRRPCTDETIALIRDRRSPF